MKNEYNSWYDIDRIDDLDTPALLFYKERIIHNILTAINITGSASRLRPHIKTHKTKEICLLMKKAGITKFKCATIAEADILGMIQAADVLLAYQPVKAKLKRFISIIKDYPKTKFACLVDNIATADAIAKEAEENYLQIHVYIDVNTGMNRTGIDPGIGARELFVHIAALKGIMPVGIHAYDGHIHEADIELRKQQVEEAFRPVVQLKDDMQKKGFRDLTVVAGGSPTFSIHAANKDLECSPGTFVFWDYNYANNFKEQPFFIAALVLTRIISLPGENIICTDLGHKSVASENSIDKRVLFLNAPDLVAIGHSEEHLLLQAPKGHSYKIGDVLFGSPYHICPTAALYENASVVVNHQVTEEWLVQARNRRIEH